MVDALTVIDAYEHVVLDQKLGAIAGINTVIGVLHRIIRLLEVKYTSPYEPDNSYCRYGLWLGKEVPRIRYASLLR